MKSDKKSRAQVMRECIQASLARQTCVPETERVLTRRAQILLDCVERAIQDSEKAAREADR